MRVPSVFVRAIGLALAILGVVLTYNMMATEGTQVGTMSMRHGVLVFIGPLVLTAGVFMVFVTRIGVRRQ